MTHDDIPTDPRDALIEELQEKLASIEAGSYDASREELVRRITAVGSTQWKAGHWVTQRIALARERMASVPLNDLPIHERDQRIAETLAFMAERGYDFVAPGEAAVVVRDVEITTDSDLGVAYIRIARGDVAATVARGSEVNIDFGHDGQVVGVELLHVGASNTHWSRTDDAVTAAFG